MARSEYMTDSKRRLIDFFSMHRERHYSMDEIVDAVSEDGVHGRSTLYRQVNKLLDDGVVRRFESEGSRSFVYQFADFHDDCANHFHLKCTNCGKLIHMECEHLSEVQDHILKEHGFLIGSGKSIIYGICETCREK